MMQKLMRMDTNPRIIRWVLSFLINRPQQVRISTAMLEVVSAEVRTNTGAPQGCVLSPAFFILYTSDCRCVINDILQVKFSDNTSLTGMITTSQTEVHTGAMLMTLSASATI